MSEFAADVATHWLGQVQSYFVEYGCWFVLIVMFLKSLIFLGPFMPGATVLVLAGGLARHGKVSLLLLALSAFVGTAVGDAVSYFIGQKAGHWLLRSKRFGRAVVGMSGRVRTEPALLVFCHFETVLRMLVPAAAGMSGLPFRRWMLLNALGSALWVAAYIAAGYFLSFSSALAVTKTAAPVVIGLLVVIIGGRYLLNRSARRRALAREVAAETQS